MGRNIAIGIQNFNEIIENNCFYVDKTNFIKEWWDSRDSVTLITRPRRFGKTLTMSMVEQFFLWIIQAEVIYLRGLRFGRRRIIVRSKEPIR